MSFFSFKKIILFVVTCLFMIACASSTDQQLAVPAGILSEEKFTKLIVDFTLAESAGNINVKNIPSDKQDSAYAFDPLKENNVLKSQYDSTIAFYARHPALYKKIYENVLVNLSKMQIKKDTAKVVPVSK